MSFSRCALKKEVLLQMLPKHNSNQGGYVNWPCLAYVIQVIVL